MSADDNLIRFPSELAKHPEPISAAENMQRAVNSARAMLAIFEPRDRFTILGILLASECCAYGGRNACRTNAVHKLGECWAEAVVAVGKTFPPLSEEGWQ